MWFRRKPKNQLSGCLAMFLLIAMTIFGFGTLFIMAIIESFQ